jgi:hypothetical protein
MGALAPATPLAPGRCECGPPRLTMAACPSTPWPEWACGVGPR